MRLHWVVGTTAQAHQNQHTQVLKPTSSVLLKPGNCGLWCFRDSGSPSCEWCLLSTKTNIDHYRCSSTNPQLTRVVLSWRLGTSTRNPRVGTPS